MGLGFTQQGRIGAQVRSIAREQIDKALQECSDPGIELGTLVHKLRRHCKKLRGLLRLAAPRLKRWQQEDQAFRDAARSLAGTRDAAVLVDTFTHLVALDRKRGDAARIEVGQRARVTAWLQARADRPLAGAARADMLETYVALFEMAGARTSDWSLTGHGFEQIGDGLEKTYRRMRDGLERAEIERSAEALHDWRKDTKYHWHHIGLLLAVAPDLLAPRRASLDRLGEMLGDHHNLAVLAETLADHDFGSGIAGAIADQQAVLADTAFALGRQLVAEKPAKLRDRFEQYWSLLPEKS